MINFPLAVKSTIDKLVYDLASVNGYDFFDLDGSYLLADHVESMKPAITAGSFVCTPSPRDPFYSVHFEVAAKTSTDQAQYDSLYMTSMIQDLFQVGLQFYVADYSGDTIPTNNLGWLYINYTASDTPGFDKISGLRPVRIMASGFRYP